MSELSGSQALLDPHRGPSTFSGLWQLTTTVGLFLAPWSAAVGSLAASYGLTLLFRVPAAGVLLRIFVLRHDCGHRALLRSKRGNDWAGIALGVLTWTPCHRWRREHAVTPVNMKNDLA